MKLKAYEAVYSKPSKIDAEKGILYGVKLLGKSSKNGREYTDKALKDAAKLYESLGIDLDHNKSKNDRSLRDLIGLRPRNVKVVPNDGVYGDIHLLLSDPVAQKLLEAADRDPAIFGVSHEADLGGKKDKGKIVVESVTKVHSLDLVRHPATTNGAFESKENQMPEDISRITEATQEAQPEDCKELLARAMVAAEKEGNTELASKIHKLLKPEKNEEGGAEEETEAKVEGGGDPKEPYESFQTRSGITEEDILILAKPYNIPSSTATILSKTLANHPIKDVLTVFESLETTKTKTKVSNPEQDSGSILPLTREERVKKYRVN